MSVVDRELSDYNSRPLELYRFSMGTTEWYYTSADHQITVGTVVYEPIYISRSSFTRSGDINKSSITIDIMKDADVTLGFRSGWLPATMTLTISRFHYLDLPEEAVMIWKGRVTGCKWSGSIATLTSDSVFTLFKRMGLRRIYQVGCPHVLFGAQCGLNPAGWVTSSTITVVNGSHVELSGTGGKPNGFFIGGVFTVGSTSMMIVDHSGDVIRLLDGISEAVVGIAVTLLPGCDRTLSKCSGAFFNEHNFGGLPFLPNDNPFTGDSIV